MMKRSAFWTLVLVIAIAMGFTAYDKARGGPNELTMRKQESWKPIRDRIAPEPDSGGAEYTQ